MKLKKIYANAYNSYMSLCGLIEGENFEDAYNYLKDLKYDVFNKDDELFDCNFDWACLTVNNINGKASVNYKNVEVWDDTQFVCCLGDFSAEELAKLGGIKD